jgi:hypothetical protein
MAQQTGIAYLPFLNQSPHEYPLFHSSIINSWVGKGIVLTPLT